MDNITSCGLWEYDDVPPCARTTILNFSYPVLWLALSFVIVLYGFISSAVGNKIQLNEDLKPLLATASTDADDSDIYNTAMMKSKHFDLTNLDYLNAAGKPHGHSATVPKSTAQTLRVCFEFLLVAAEFAASISLLVLSGFDTEFTYTNKLVLLAYWSYLFVLAIGRFYIQGSNSNTPSLFGHSTFLYGMNFVPAALLFRSAVMNHLDSSLVKIYYIFNFAATTGLFVSNLFSNLADRPASVYITNDNSDPSPESTSSLISFITYTWLDKLIWKGYKNALTPDQIWSLAESDYALNVLKGFEAAKTTTRFSIKIFTHFKTLFLWQAFYSVLESFLVFTPTLLLKQVLEYVADPTILPRNVAWLLVFLMPVAKIVDSMAAGYSLFLGRRVCLRMRSVIIGEVYAKALRRKITVSVINEDEDATLQDPAKKQNKNEGEKSKTAELGAIINLMAIDAFKVSEVCGYLHYFSGAIIMIFVCLLALYQLLGWSALVGASVICVTGPANYYFAKYLGNLQKAMLAITDKRIQKLNETLQSIRIIKFFAWEDNFFEDIMNLRNQELQKLRRRCIMWVLSSTIWLLTPTLITVFSFYCYIMIEGKPLTAPVAFTALSLFTLLRAPLDQLADMTALVIQSKVSLDRVGDFLDEVETSKYDQLTAKPSADSPSIGFENATFAWNKSDVNSFKLRDINVAFKEEKLNVIFGPTGSGKTSLLLALLGEMDLIDGKVFLPGIIPRDELVIDKATGLTDSVAYCSQSAWLFNDSIRQNILFGSPFNQDRYDNVIEACGLTRDLEILSAGDLTEIGEKGITLSGGQKQRVSLARALYSNSKTVLLDDCLSAVDSHTSLWIYENCICGPLMTNRTCILVSHNVPLTVQNADWVIMMANGRVTSQNTPAKLLASGDLGTDDLIKSSVLNSRNQSSTDLSKDAQKAAKNEDFKAKSAKIEAKLKAFNDEQNATEHNSVPGEADKSTGKFDGKLVEEEAKAVGAVSRKVYSRYLRFFGGLKTWTFLLSLYILSQAVYIVQSWWLREWSQSDQSSVKTTVLTLGVKPIYDTIRPDNIIQTYTKARDAIHTLKQYHEPLYYIMIYGIIGLVYCVVTCTKILATFFAGVDASNRMFIKVLTSVLNARLRFFDKTPIGRIMNRFSKDIEAVDQDLTPFAEFTFSCVVTCAFTLCLITFITPGFLIFAFLIAFVYYVIGLLYISLSRDLNRYESISKSPIHQHFSESLSGIATIRAYGVESRFMRQNITKIDANNKPFFYVWVANRWLSVRIDMAGAMVTFISGIFVLLSINKLDAGLAGLSLSYAIAFSESALWIVRLYSIIEMNMNSVERLQEYFEIDQEPPHKIPETEPRKSWPESGEIDVRDVSLRYAPNLPRVIKNISFHVGARNKVGIVGRTGAGKSTIITAFFRFLDPETGSIFIDGVDICKIGLKNLRQALTIIPQDPTLFTGTIRSNLDPFGSYTDEEMFEALRRVNLVTAEGLKLSPAEISLQENKNQFLDLESTVSEGGSNLSQGQRQLMCLARSLLRNPKVILLDEATASIDYESDALIQQTIREEFSSSTILTIAHRLRSIIDYDKILVMDAGQVVEYDDPYTLIIDKNSLFYSMCENSGELETLTKLAKEAFVAKKNNTVNVSQS